MRVSTVTTLLVLVSVPLRADATCPNSAASCNPTGGASICSYSGASKQWQCDTSVLGGTNGSAITVIWDDIAGACTGTTAAAPGYCAWGATSNGNAFCCEYTGWPSDMGSVHVQTGDVGPTIQDSIHFQYFDGSTNWDLDTHTAGTPITGYAYGRGGIDSIDGSRVGSADYDEVLDGGAGEDSIYGYGGDDTCYGGADDDVVDGGGGADVLYGGGGADTITGDAGNDTMYGGPGNDWMNGDDGVDTVNGDDDNDDICGGLLADTMSGGAGDDSIDGGAGADAIDGGSNYDDCEGYVGTTTTCEAMVVAFTCP